MDFFTTINLIAICVIAYYAYASHRLSNQSDKREKEFRESLAKINNQHQQELTDLYQAIVIATLMSGNSDPRLITRAIEIFNEHYPGKTEIFKKDNEESNP